MRILCIGRVCLLFLKSVYHSQTFLWIKAYHPWNSSSLFSLHQWVMLCMLLQYLRRMNKVCAIRIPLRASRTLKFCALNCHKKTIALRLVFHLLSQLAVPQCKNQLSLFDYKLAVHAIWGFLEVLYRSTFLLSGGHMGLWTLHQSVQNKGLQLPANKLVHFLLLPLLSFCMAHRALTSLSSMCSLCRKKHLCHDINLLSSPPC